MEEAIPPPEDNKAAKGASQSLVLAVFLALCLALTTAMAYVTANDLAIAREQTLARVPPNLATVDGPNAPTLLPDGSIPEDQVFMPTVVPTPGSQRVNTPIYPVLPELRPYSPIEPVDGWLNTPAKGFEDFLGKVLLVEFWAYDCGLCIDRIPYDQANYLAFRDRGFQIIGVHSPGLKTETDLERVYQAVRELGVIWPVALDSNNTVLQEWSGQSKLEAPLSVLIDPNGQVRFMYTTKAAGHGQYAHISSAIEALLVEFDL